MWEPEQVVMPPKSSREAIYLNIAGNPIFLAYPVRQGRGAAPGSIRGSRFPRKFKSCMCRPQSKMFARPHIRAETAGADLKYPTSCSQQFRGSLTRHPIRIMREEPADETYLIHIDKL